MVPNQANEVQVIPVRVIITVRLHLLIRHYLPRVAGCLAHGIEYESLLGFDLLYPGSSVRHFVLYLLSLLNSIIRGAGRRYEERQWAIGERGG